MLARMFALGVVSVAGGMLLAFVSVLAEAHPHVLQNLGPVIFCALGAIVFGSFVGIISSPVVIWCLRRKRLVLATPVVYTMAVVAVIVATRRGDVLDAPLAGLLTLWGSSLIVWLLLPNSVSRFLPGCCQKCGYDLRHVNHQSCPECGVSTTDQRGARDTESDGFIVRLVHSRLAGLVLLTTVGLIVGCFVLGQWLVALRFSPERFELVDDGMTRDEVTAILGPPRSSRMRRVNVEEWRYDDGVWLIMDAHYYIYFTDNAVSKKEVDWW